MDGPKSPANAATAPAKLKAGERRAETLRLRTRGKSIRNIAGTLGISKSQVHRDIKKEVEVAAKLRRESADSLIDLELAKLEALEEEAWDIIENGQDNTVVAAIAEGRRISERRSKLLGLDAAQKIEHSGVIPTWLDLYEVADGTGPDS